MLKMPNRANQDTLSKDGADYVLSNFETNYCKTFSNLELVAMIECIKDSIRFGTIKADEGKILIAKLEYVRKKGV